MKKSRKRVRSAAEIVKELADLKERAPQGKRTYEEGERIQDLWDELEAVRAKENEPLTKLQELEDELIDLKSNRYWGGATEEIEARIRELEGMKIKTRLKLEFNRRKKEMNAGIDYGLGKTNIDAENGIRFGVISQHTVGEAWYESAEADYGEAHCPKCGREAETLEEADREAYEDYEIGKYAVATYACHLCKYLFDGEEAFGEEPLGWYIDDGEYKATDCLDSDIMIIKSPYYTYAPFCSPCVPGAGNLDDASEAGVKTYCFGHDWFEDGKAPYRVYRVSDDSIVEPEGKN